MESECQNDNGWTIVQPKKNLLDLICNLPTPQNISTKEIMSSFGQILSEYGANGAYLYGSRAKKTNRPDSDVDIIVFWKTVVEVESLEKIMYELKNVFGLHIDLVNMLFKEKSKKSIAKSTQEQCFCDEVICSSIKMFGDYTIQYYIDSSQRFAHMSTTH